MNPAPPKTLPANFNGWDTQPIPKTLPADFGDWDAPSAAAAPRLSDNTKREGVYAMTGPNGQQQGIPYSNVSRAQTTGYNLAGPDAERYRKDRAADPAPAISAYTPGMMDRMRGVVANSTIGHSIESTLPGIADALHIHPTETVNSPTYQSDKNQILAPQYLLPDPTSKAGHLTRGVLTGAGQLTSGKNLATMAGISATAGLAAPLAAGAGTAATVARIANTGAKIGFAGMGVKGIYDDARRAKELYDQGHTGDALEAAGAGVPNAALTLPLLAGPIEGAGNFLQDKGVDLMDSYLKAGKKAYRYGAEPGKSVLEEGPGTSIGLTRERFAQGVDAAKDRLGGTIPGIIDDSTAQIPRPSLRSGQDAIMRSKTGVLNGPGGDVSTIPALEVLRGTMSPLVDAPGFASPREVYNAKRNMDENINWGRDMDPKDATVNNTRREMRSDLSSQLYDALPELREPSEKYSGLSSASKLATDRTFDKNGSVFNPFRIGTGVLTGLASEGLSHDPGLSTGIGIATGMLPEIAKAPLVKTGGATALYQVGRGVAATGRGLSRFAMPTGWAGAEQPLENADAAQSYQGANEGNGQSTPPNGAYQSTKVIPEIIRPGDMSRSKFGVGADGRAGVLIRPLGRLPSPAPAIPEATPYTFGGSQLRPLTAVPARRAEGLLGSIGSSAHTLPASILEDVLPSGSPDAQATALRRANLGPYGGLVPSRLLGRIDEPILKDLMPKKRHK